MENVNVNGVASPTVDVQPTANAVTPVVPSVTELPTQTVVPPIADVVTPPIVVTPPAQVVAPPTTVAEQVVTVSAEIDPFEAMFAGDTVMDSAPELNTVTMEEGIAQITSVALQTSKGGHPMVVITFGDVLDLEDATRGHIEYLSCTDGWRWKSTVERVRHLVTHSNNPLIRDAFNACFKDEVGNPLSPFMTLKNNLGQPIQMTDWKQLDALKLAMKDDTVTAIFFDKKDKITRTAVKFRNPLEFCTKVANAFQGLVGLQFELKLTEDKKGFQRVKKFLPLPTFKTTA